jgi:hypothetical protein
MIRPSVADLKIRFYKSCFKSMESILPTLEIQSAGDIGLATDDSET